MSLRQLNSKTNDIVLLLLRLFEGTETVSCCLSLQMAWMEMDWNLIKLANFFKFWCYVFQKSSRNLLKFIWYLHRSFTEAFCLKVMILAQNWPKTAKSSRHCSFNKFTFWGINMIHWYIYMLQQYNKIQMSVLNLLQLGFNCSTAETHYNTLI